MWGEGVGTLPHDGALGTCTVQGAGNSHNSTVLELVKLVAVARLQAGRLPELADEPGCYTLTSVNKRVIRLICYMWNVKK